MRFTIPHLLTVMFIVALALAFDMFGELISILVWLGGPCLLIVLAVRAYAKLRVYLTFKLAPFLYSRNLFPWRLWASRSATARLALNEFACRLCGDGQYQQASELMDVVIQFEPSMVQYWLNRGACHYYAGEFESAEKDLSHALAKVEDYEHATIYRGFARLYQGRHQDAVDDLARVSCDHAEHSLCAYYRGVCYEWLCEWQAAAEDYELAHNLDPADVNAALALARLQAACPDESIRDGDKAVLNAHAICVRTAWEDWTSVGVLASAYAEAGRFEKALEFANQALELAPVEEKPERQKRIEQYRAGAPFRLESTSPQSDPES